MDGWLRRRRAPWGALVLALVLPPAGAEPPAHRDRVVATAAARPARAAPARVPACEDAPARGVALVYARPADVASRLGALRASLLDAAARASAVLEAAAPRAPKRIRYVCGITEAEIPSSARTFGAVKRELRARGLSSEGRAYLVWWDGPSPRACGEADLADDDRPDPAVNRSNRGPSYALVYRPGGRAFCDWATVLHEILHLLGGVQDSAPHSTGRGHCTDGHDLLCRADAAGVSVTKTCRGIVVDCGGDDYFSPSPPAGSYLAGHWNVYDSSWLTVR